VRMPTARGVRDVEGGGCVLYRGTCGRCEAELFVAGRISDVEVTSRRRASLDAETLAQPPIR